METLVVGYGRNRVKIQLDAEDVDRVNACNWSILIVDKAEGESYQIRRRYYNQDKKFRSQSIQRFLVGEENIPKGSICAFRDKNTFNCQKSNLLVGTKAEINTLIHTKEKSVDPEPLGQLDIKEMRKALLRVLDNKREPYKPIVYAHWNKLMGKEALREMFPDVY